ncbi:MAG: hypothetical protein ACFFCH_08705 [Promethearchaeota archaeon]
MLPQMDASALINYSITFENYGTDFDYIDIGLPNSYYVLSSFRAFWSLEGASYVELTTIEPSEVVSIGIQILIPSALRPGTGDNGTLLVWGNQQRMVYLDTDPATPGYVGYEFTPTWYDSAYNRGTDYLGCHLHFPNGFYNGTLAKYHYAAPTRFYWTNISLVYTWEYTSLSNYQGILHGISFPYHESYITTYYTDGGTTGGFDIWAFLDEYGEFLVYIVIFLVIFGACCISVIKNAALARFGRRLVKRGYLPPAVKVEALGIRRGLTVVEAAVLNETPLDRVFTMIVFGLLKKALVTVQREGKAKPTFHANPAAIANAASQKGRLHYYERLFLKAITSSGNLHKTQIRTMLNTLIKTTARKLEGYSRTDTKVFYTRMIDQAWHEIDLAATPAAQASALTEYAEWLLLTPDYEHRIKPYHHYYVPGWYWWWLYAAHPRPHTLTPTATLPTGPIHPTTPITLTNFANATVLGTQHFANSVVTGFQTLANQIATAFRPPPPPSARSSYSGRSCACACACVSCACACAGGGR